MPPASPTVSVILSTLFRKRKALSRLLADLEAQTMPPDEVVIVFQDAGSDRGFKRAVEDFLRETVQDLNVQHDVQEGGGLSRGRNRALQLAKGDILLIADDDCRYPPDAMVKVVKAHRELAWPDVATFRIGVEGDPEREYKKYRDEVFRHGFLSLFRTSSIEVSFRREKVKEVRFDERFGLGARWPMGEEMIFLMDLWHRGASMWYVPVEIVQHEYASSGKSLGPEKLIALGAGIARVTGHWGPVFGLAFIAKNRLVGNLEPSFLRSYLLLLRGHREFRSTVGPRD